MNHRSRSTSCQRRKNSPSCLKEKINKPLVPDLALNFVISDVASRNSKHKNTDSVEENLFKKPKINLSQQELFNQRYKRSCGRNNECFNELKRNFHLPTIPEDIVDPDETLDFENLKITPKNNSLFDFNKPPERNIFYNSNGGFNKSFSLFNNINEDFNKSFNLFHNTNEEFNKNSSLPFEVNVTGRRENTDNFTNFLMNEKSDDVSFASGNDLASDTSNSFDVNCQLYKKSKWDGFLNQSTSIDSSFNSNFEEKTTNPICFYNQSNYVQNFPNFVKPDVLSKTTVFETTTYCEYMF